MSARARRAEGARSILTAPRGPAPLNQRFAENLIGLRGRVDLSQERTAERAGLHISEVSLLERGQRTPQLDTIVRLAGAVEAAPCAFLLGMAWELGGSVQCPGAYARRQAETAHSDCLESR